jgi:hypothetical protein
VRGGDGDIPTYSALDAPQWGDEALERLLVGEPGMRVEELKLAGAVRIGGPSNRYFGMVSSALLFACPA